MAFVSCGQFKTSQEEQDKKAISADDSLLDKSSGVGGGKVTVDKIKQAVAGDVAVSVQPHSGITGNGTQAEPLGLNLGDAFQIGENGKIQINPTNVASVRLVDASGQYHLGNLVGA